jgi:hypothetical protein
MKWWVWAAVALLLVSIIGLRLRQQHKWFFSCGPQWQACHDQAVATLTQCAANACTSAGGQSPGPGACRDVQNQNTYNNLVQACIAQETASLNYCNSFYHCP